ncbi:MAG: RNB domain-containing ribonuclease [Deltaproteobacteria bacterium]|nr:RNB domain-containing ribonuclease [Deltaproteobacteria bacterium]
MNVGRIVFFFEQKKIVGAVCLEVRDSRLHCLTEENREITLGANRIVQTSSQTLDPRLPREELVQRLRAVVERQKDLVGTLSVPELWELVVGEGEAFTLRELAELIFDSRISFDQEMALFRALAEDRVYFKQKGEHFLPRSPERVQEILLQAERAAEEEREIEEAGRWLAAIWAGEREPPPPSGPKIVSLLKEMALFGAEAPELAKVRDLLQRAKISPEAVFDLLVRLGEWQEDENLHLLRHQIPFPFPEAVQREAEQVMAVTAPALLREVPGREDLTSLPILTIDSESTRDIDDALSLERLGNEFQVGIHITDVAGPLDGRREIFQEAMARGTSIYLPDQRIPMIPPALSEGICSLVAGEPREALSLLVVLDAEGRIREQRITPSLVRVRRRLSYDSADRLMEDGDEELTALKRLAERLAQRRMAQGAFFIPRPERIVRVSREKEICILRRDRESPSQKVVSEFMILANSLFALFFKEKIIPAIYRGQMEPREKIPPMVNFDPLQAYRLRRIMNRVEIGTRPLRHAGLGVEAYLTITSPIRRFYDLLMEQQILRFLRGEAPIPEEELEEIIARVGPALSRVGVVQELTERYWILRYLEKRIGSTTPAVILDRFPHKHLVHLSEFLLEIEMPPPAGHDLVPGDQVLMRVEKVNARAGIIKISPL